MRTVKGECLGPPENYRLVEQPEPSVGPGEVRVRVHAISLGYADMLAAGGGHQRKIALPHTPGSEFAGTVEAIGTSVSFPAPGDRMTGVTAFGALAEQIVVPAAAVRPMSPSLSFEEAACLRVDYLTALHALADRGGLIEGERLLVLGAAGGVGRAAVQIGNALGARIVAGASTPSKRAFAGEQGADILIDYSRADWRDVLREAIGAVDIVFDPVGGTLLETAFRCLAWKGRYLVVGFASREIPRLPVNLALVKGAALIGVEVGRFLLEEPEAAALANDRIDALVENGMIHPIVGRVFEMADFAAAMRAVGHGDILGKVVVRTTLPE